MFYNYKKTFQEFILDKMSGVDLSKQSNTILYYLDNANLEAYLLFCDKTFTNITRICITEQEIQELYEDQNSKYQLYGDIVNLYNKLVQVLEDINQTQVSIIKTDCQIIYNSP